MTHFPQLDHDICSWMPGTGYRVRGHDLVAGESWVQSAGGLYLPQALTPRPRPTCIDLFAGCGGFSLGMLQAGWDVVAAVEWDAAAAVTHLVNLGCPETVVHVHPDRRDDWDRCLPREEVRARKQTRPPAWGSGWISSEPEVPPTQHFWLWDARELTGQQLLEPLGMAVGELDCVVGGPPCQGFSNMGKRVVMDPRNSLAFEFARIVLELRPKTFVMENVPGLLTMVTPDGIPVIDALARVIADGGWSTYESLQRSLRGMPGARGAVRKDGGRSRAPEPPPGAEELDLFAAVDHG